MKRRGYFSYLLRLWQTSDGEAAIWRASLEIPGSGEQRSFADFEALIRFLRKETLKREEDKPTQEL